MQQVGGSSSSSSGGAAGSRNAPPGAGNTNNKAPPMKSLKRSHSQSQRSGASSLFPTLSSSVKAAQKSIPKRTEKSPKLHAFTENLFDTWHRRHDLEKELKTQESLKNLISDAVDKQEHLRCNLLHMVATNYLDFHSVMRLRCVSKDMYALKVDLRKLKILMTKKVSRFLDFGANCTMGDVCTKGGLACPEYYTNHFDKEGTPFMRGVCVYKASEPMRVKWIDNYLFEKLEWNPDPAKCPFESLKRLWDFMTKQKHGGVPKDTVLLDDQVPNRMWSVRLVKPQRWQEFIKARCNWRLKLQALLYHHHRADDHETASHKMGSKSGAASSVKRLKQDAAGAGDHAPGGGEAGLLLCDAGSSGLADRDTTIEEEDDLLRGDGGAGGTGGKVGKVAGGAGAARATLPPEDPNKMKTVLLNLIMREIGKNKILMGELLDPLT